MFGDETNRLIDEAMAARESAQSARSAAREKAAARQSAADEEATANAALSSSSADLTRATQAAIAAITQEFALQGSDGATAAAGTRPNRPYLAPAGIHQRTK